MTSLAAPDDDDDGELTILEEGGRRAGLGLARRSTRSPREYIDRPPTRRAIEALEE